MPTVWTPLQMPSDPISRVRRTIGLPGLVPRKLPRVWTAVAIRYSARRQTVSTNLTQGASHGLYRHQLLRA